MVGIVKAEVERAVYCAVLWCVMYDGKGSKQSCREIQRQNRR